MNIIFIKTWSAISTYECLGTSCVKLHCAAFYIWIKPGWVYTIGTPSGWVHFTPQNLASSCKLTCNINLEAICHEVNNSIIIIILYFENVAFFHAKLLGSDVCPRVDNQTSGDTLQDLTRSLAEKSPSASHPPMGIGASFWWRDALPHQPVIGLGKRHWNLETSSVFSGSWIPPPYSSII